MEKEIKGKLMIPLGHDVQYQYDVFSDSIDLTIYGIEAIDELLEAVQGLKKAMLDIEKKRKEKK